MIRLIENCLMALAAFYLILVRLLVWPLIGAGIAMLGLHIQREPRGAL